MFMKEIKIFVGSGDSSELRDMARDREQARWAVGRNSHSPRVQEALRSAYGAVVRIEGGAFV